MPDLTKEEALEMAIREDKVKSKVLPHEHTFSFSKFPNFEACLVKNKITATLFVCYSHCIFFSLSLLFSVGLLREVSRVDSGGKGGSKGEEKGGQASEEGGQGEEHPAETVGRREEEGQGKELRRHHSDLKKKKSLFNVTVF